MKSLNICFPYKQFENIEELSITDQELVAQSMEAAKKAYAPYSGYKVGAALRLENTIVVDGSNQENAAYPSGLCAERVTLNTASHRFPKVAGDTLAISAFSKSELVETPASPCGECRQVIAEYASRFEKPLRLILVGKEQVLIIEDAFNLLPLQFGKNNLV